MSPPIVPALDPIPLDGELDSPQRRAAHAQAMGRWAAASSLVRAIESARHDLHYGDGPGEMLDLYPTPRANAPVLVFLPGGWWQAANKAVHAFVAPSFTWEGAMVVVLGHAPAAEVGHERVALQAARGVAWVHRHAALYGGDPRRIVLVGHGSGAHLAAMLLACAWKQVDRRLPSRLVHGALAISGVYDLAPLKGRLKIRADVAARLSPASFPAPGRPLLAVAGAQEGELFRQQTALIRERWGRAAVPVCETIPFADHDTVLHGLADPRGRLHLLARELLGLKD